MDIWEGDKLFLFLAFVIPGFISLKAYQLLFPSAMRSSQSQLIDAIAYSSVNYAILIVPIFFIQSSNLSKNYSFLYWSFYIFVFFIAPIIWVVLWKVLRTKEFFQKNAVHPTERPWDFVFSQRKMYWIRVTLKSGEIIGGRFANNSFASSNPAPEQLYLEERWLLNEDGSFDRPKNQSAGVIILSSEISHVELNTYSEEA